jgi:hypothetical protein
MTVEQLIQFQHAQPFRPYRIHLADGRHLDVGHQDFLARSPAGRTAIVCKRDETFELIDLLLVASLEVLNGNRRRRTSQTLRQA